MVALDGRPVSSHAIDGPRPATPDEVPEIIALVDAEMRAGTAQTLLSDYPLVYAPENLRNVRVIAVDGRVVSVVPFLPRRIRFGAAEVGIGIISPTATLPAFRHRGFASRCLASCIEAMRDADCRLSVLWTREQTFPFYEHAGYRAVESQAFGYRLVREDARRLAVDPRVTISHLDAADERSLEAIRRIHERDGDGIHRTSAEYRALFSLPAMRTLIAQRSGRVAGYAVVSDAVNKPGLIEAGGDGPAIETLLHRVLVDRADGIEAHANLGQTALSMILDRVVPRRRRRIEGGLMVRIDDVAGLLEALGAPAGAASHADVDPADWPYALFGSHASRSYQPPAGLAVRLGIPLPVTLTIPVLDRS
jgi:predicted N-acetyltransferase YhbS